MCFDHSDLGGTIVASTFAVDAAEHILVCIELLA